MKLVHAYYTTYSSSIYGSIITFRVYFRILLKRGQKSTAKFVEGGEQPHYITRGKPNSYVGAKASPGTPLK